MKKYFLFFALVLLFNSSCDEDFFDQTVEVDIPEHTPALAVTSYIQNVDTILWAYVSNSVGILDENDPETVTDAVVELYNDDALLYTLPHFGQGIYGWEIEAPFGIDDSQYKLVVSKAGFETVSSEQTMPEPVGIVNATFEDEGTITPEGDRVDEIVIEINDPPNIDNFYKVIAFLEYIDEDENIYTSSIYLESNNPITRDTYDGLYFSDATFDGNIYELRLWDYNVFISEQFVNPKIVLQLVSLSKDRFFRETSVSSYQDTEDNPFAEPTVIYSNMENGFGIFSLESVGPRFEIEL